MVAKNPRISKRKLNGFDSVQHAEIIKRSHESERDLLASCLLVPGNFKRFAGRISPDYILDPHYSDVWTCAEALLELERDVSIQTLRDAGVNCPADKLGAIVTEGEFAHIHAAYHAEQVVRNYVTRLAMAGADFDTIRETVNRSDFRAPIALAAPAMSQGLERAEPIVDGLIRRGEVCNVIAPPKLGKSWFALQMAFSVAAGCDWLRFACRQSPVTIIDNELQPAELANRIGATRRAMTLDDSIVRQVEVFPCRGFGMSIDGALPMLKASRHRPSLIVLDALYRFIPRGVSEIENSGMMSIYNELDRIAREMDSAIVVVHHSSKGDQSGKSVTDTGSGAGAISRAADTHLILRAHELEGHVVAEAVTRSFVAPEPMSLRWSWPLWSVANEAPKLRTPKTCQDLRQERMDGETQSRLLKALSDRPGAKLTDSQLRTATSFGKARVERGLRLLIESGQVTSKTVRNRATRKVRTIFYVEK